MKRLEVKTRRLILRPLKKSDYLEWLDAYTKMLPKKSKWDSLPATAKYSTPKWYEKIRKIHDKKAKEDDYYRYYAFEKKTGVVVGQIDFDVYVRSTHQFANFGYLIFNRHWGKGYGQEIAAVGLRIGFKQLKLNRLEAAINLDNRKSIRLVKAIGMRREGIKKRYWFEYGKWVDHLIYVANPEDIGLKSIKPF